jgi:hypothetical protein
MLSYPLCIGGERSFVPEDVGGTPGFQNFQVALVDENHEEHEQFKTWIGGYYNPEGFDANLINRSLHMTRWFPKNASKTRDSSLRVIPTRQ